jgi:glucokinase
MPNRRAIGVDIGGTRLLVGAVDAGLDVHHRTQRVVSGLDQSSLLDAAVDAIEEARRAAGSEIAAVGFGLPSPAEASGRTLSLSEPPLADVAVADVMAERLGLPAFADTDANVAALAEHRAGAALGSREAVVLMIGAGIGAGVILGGEVQRGLGVADAFHGAAPAVIELAHDGDRAAIEALAALGRRLGEVVAGLVAAYEPQVVVVGGAMVAAGELLLAPARAELRTRLGGEDVPIVAARFGVDAALVGAAALAFDGVQRRAA